VELGIRPCLVRIRRHVRGDVQDDRGTSRGFAKQWDESLGGLDCAIKVGLHRLADSLEVNGGRVLIFGHVGYASVVDEDIEFTFSRGDGFNSGSNGGQGCHVDLDGFDGFEAFRNQFFSGNCMN